MIGMTNKRTKDMSIYYYFIFYHNCHYYYLIKQTIEQRILIYIEEYKSITFSLLKIFFSSIFVSENMYLIRKKKLLTSYRQTSLYEFS